MLAHVPGTAFQRDWHRKETWLTITEYHHHWYQWGLVPGPATNIKICGCLNPIVGPPCLQFCLWGFNQPWIQSTAECIWSLEFMVGWICRCRTHRYRRPTVCLLKNLYIIRPHGVQTHAPERSTVLHSLMSAIQQYFLTHKNP